MHDLTFHGDGKADLKSRGVLAHVLWTVVPSSCIALLALWLFVGFAGERLLHQKSAETLKLTADQQSWIVANKIHALMERLRDIAGNALTINAFVDPLSVEHFLEPFLRSMRLSNDGHATVAMVDFQGEIIASNREVDLVDGTLSAESWHDAAMAGEETLTIVEGAMVAAVPIRVGSLPEGAIWFRLPPEDTGKLLSSEKHDGPVWLTRRDGRQLHGPEDGEKVEQQIEMVISEPVALAGFPALEVTSAIVASDAQDHLASLLHRFLSIAFLVDLTALILGIYVAANLVARPLNRLMTDIRSRQRQTDTATQLKTEGPRELQDLADAFNQAMDRQSELTKQLEQALANEKEINGLQRQFVSLVSHEFRTPLAIIDGNTRLILRKIDHVPRERIGKGLEKCRAATHRLVALMESILSSSRLEAGTIEFKPERCQLVDLLEEAISSQQDISPGHDIVADIGRLPGDIVGDPKLLYQVFANLLSNAVKYSPETSTIWIKGEHNCRVAEISVRDEGVGIPEEECAKLFSRFFRASTAMGIPGTGIGLHLVKNLVEMHGGEILVRSAEGEGSTFTVRLPIGKLPEATLTAA